MLKTQSILLEVIEKPIEDAYGIRRSLFEKAYRSLRLKKEEHLSIRVWVGYFFPLFYLEDTSLKLPRLGIWSLEFAQEHNIQL